MYYNTQRKQDTDTVLEETIRNSLERERERVGLGDLKGLMMTP
jgi:hypothetical protein